MKVALVIAVCVAVVFAQAPAPNAPGTATTTVSDLAKTDLQAAEALRATEASEAAQKIHWNYCMDGPGLWSQLDDSFGRCGSGLSQSPVNIVESEVQANGNLKPLDLAYSGSKAHLENNGHALGGSFDAGSILSIGRKQYELLSFEVKVPAEHQINGNAAAAEFQFLHRSSSRDTVVVSVLADIGDAHAELDKIVKLFPASKSQVDIDNVDVNAAGFFPSSKQYFQYQGSLSTPPCREGVQVVVIKARINISAAQLEELKTRIPFAARPAQPLHGRSIQGSAYAEDANGVAISPATPAKPATADWSYCSTGPDSWANLSPLFTLCSKGEHQSPINIVRGNVAINTDLPPIQFSYEATDLIVQNAVHTIQINNNGKSAISYSGKAYNLLSMTTHTPSEHLLDGSPAPMELHFVHKSEDNRLAIVAVLVTEGEENQAIASFWSNLPRSKVTVDFRTTFDFTSLLPKTAPSGYYSYQGSLPQPPCDENVQWFVIQEPITFSANQIKMFQAIIPHNARPVNNLYGRRVAAPAFVNQGIDVQNVKTLADISRNAAAATEDTAARK